MTQRIRTKTVTKIVRLRDISDYQNMNRIYLDQSFQSEKRWELSDNQDYMESAFEGRAVTPITLALIDALVVSLDLAFGKDDEDYKFFNELKNKGYKYISIDGNNRDICISEFFNDKFPLKNMKYMIGEPNLDSFEAKKDNNKYSTLPPNVKKYVEDININLLIVTQADRLALAKLFDAVNKGMNLNSQEKRNAIMCIFGIYVRDLVNEFKEGFQKIYTEKAMNRRLPDELVVTASNIVKNGNAVGGITANTRTGAYVDNSDEQYIFQKKVRPIFKTILKDFVEPYGAGGIKIAAKIESNFTDLVMLLDYMNSHSIKIDDNKSFYDWWIESQSARLDDEKILYTSNGKSKDVRTYAGLQRGTRKEFLSIRRDMLIESLSTIPDNIITHRDAKRPLDFKLRYSFWKRQGGICPLEKKRIEPAYIWDTSITHLDHDIPWSKGGSSSEENGQLVFANANLSKGNSLDFIEMETSETKNLKDLEEDILI